MTDKELVAEFVAAGNMDCPAIHTEETMHGSKLRWFCTRPKDHSGVHAACGTRSLFIWWSADYQPLPNFLLS